MKRKYQEAKQAKIQGDVYVHVTISATGSLENASISKGLGKGLDEEAIKAVKKWTFAPGMSNCKPSEGGGTVKVTFSLGASK